MRGGVEFIREDLVLVLTTKTIKLPFSKTLEALITTCSCMISCGKERELFSARYKGN